MMMKTGKKMWANLEMDNARDTARGGIGNWYPVEIPSNVDKNDWADYISDRTGFLVYNLAEEIHDALKKRQGWVGWWA